jgi:hypothetical protein
MPDVIRHRTEEIASAVANEWHNEQTNERRCARISRAGKNGNHCHRQKQPENIPIMPANQLQEEFMHDNARSLNVTKQNAESGENKVLRR